MTPHLLHTLYTRTQHRSSGLHSWRLVSAALMLAALAMLPACASSVSTNTTGGGGASATATTAPAAPTATPLSEVPQITLAFCQGLVSLSDANSTMKPVSPATSIVPDNAQPGGSCSYVNPQVNLARGGLVFSLFFQPFPAGTSLAAIAQQGIAEAEAKGTIPPGVKFTVTPVSGIGDQAEYLGFSGTVEGVLAYYGSLYTTIGRVALSCFNFGLGTPTTPQQPALTQLCAQAASRL